jgi:hypothetical protein
MRHWLALALLVPVLALAQGVQRAPPRELRAVVTVDLGSVGTNACTHTNVAVPGALIGSECATSQPSGFPDQIIVTCHVDEPSVVDLHVCNLGIPHDPPRATYSVRVFNP